MICKHLPVPVLMSGSRQDHVPRSSPSVGSWQELACRDSAEPVGSRQGQAQTCPRHGEKTSASKEPLLLCKHQVLSICETCSESGTRWVLLWQERRQRWGVSSLCASLTPPVPGHHRVQDSLSCGLELCKNKDLWLKDKASYPPAESLCSSPSRLWRNPNPPGMHSRVDTATPSDASHAQF